MERELIAAVEGDHDQCGISELPLDMMEEIFGKLSIKQISGCRIVCKEWNSILSSEIFLSSLPAEKPWLLICGVDKDESLSCMAYCFSTQKWRTLSLSFLPNPLGHNLRYLATTAQGLLLFGETPELCVCNPLTRSYAEIDIGVTYKFLHLVQATNGEPYLVAGSSSEIFSFQIYHYFQDSWRIKLQFAGETGCNIIRYGMVECNGVLFWRGTLPGTTVIVGYNIQDGFIKPVTVAPLRFDLFLSMVAYGSSVLVVEAFYDRSQSYRVGIIIWELFQDEENKVLWKWKEFARVCPKKLPIYFDTCWWHQRCVCVGDYLCFSTLFGRESVVVFAYNLKTGFWQYLPPLKNTLYGR